MNINEDLKLGFNEWVNGGIDNRLRKLIADFIDIYCEDNVKTLQKMNYDDQKNNIIDYITSIIFNSISLDKNLIKKYLRYYFIAYGSLDLNYNIRWYKDVFLKIPNSNDFKYEYLLSNGYPKIYEDVLNQLKQLKLLYKIDDKKIDAIKDRLEKTVVEIVPGIPDALKNTYNIFYDVNKNKILFELPMYFVRKQYEKYGKLDIDSSDKDVSNFIRKPVNIIKIVHEVNHVLQQQVLLNKSKGKSVLDENGNPISMEGDYWQDLSERMADRNAMWYLKRQYGENNWNEIVKSYQDEYYNNIVEERLNIDFGKKNDIEQRNKMVDFLSGTMPLVSKQDIYNADFDQLIKWIREYSIRSFQNSEWYLYAKKHFDMVNMINRKDIPKEIIGKVVRQLCKIANTLDDCGSCDDAIMIDNMIFKMLNN